MKFFLLALCLAAGYFVSAQRHPTQGAAIGFYRVFDIARPSTSGNMISVAYVPRAFFHERRSTSLAVTVPFSISSRAFSTKGDDLVGDFRPTFIGDLSALLDFNYGAGATLATQKRVGAFIGIGFSLGYIKLEDYYQGEQLNYFRGINYGPVANIGTRFAVGKKKRTIELKGALTQYMRIGSPACYSITTGYNF